MTYFGQLPESKNPKKDFLYLLLIILSLTLGVFYFQNSKNKKLQRYKETTAVVISKSTVYLGGTDIYVEYKKENSLIKAEPIHNSTCYRELNVGDSVQIKYSLESPKTVDFINCNTINR